MEQQGFFARYETWKTFPDSLKQLIPCEQLPNPNEIWTFKDTNVKPWFVKIITLTYGNDESADENIISVVYNSCEESGIYKSCRYENEFTKEEIIRKQPYLRSLSSFTKLYKKYK